MALELRACDRRRHKLARRLTGARAVECLKGQHGTQPHRIAAKDVSHGVVHNQQRMGLTRRPTQRAQIGHTQAKATD